MVWYSIWIWIEYYHYVKIVKMCSRPVVITVEQASIEHCLNPLQNWLRKWVLLFLLSWILQMVGYSHEIWTSWEKNFAEKVFTEGAFLTKPGPWLNTVETIHAFSISDEQCMILLVRSSFLGRAVTELSLSCWFLASNPPSYLYQACL